MAETGPEYLLGTSKRRLDVSSALGALSVGAAPFAVGIGAAYVASGSGRPFFHQERDNYSGGTFTLHKLRSLNDALVEAQPIGDFGTLDPRAGRLGRLLRATGIDEFPQLFNILDGSMSFVGPRPLPAGMLDEGRSVDHALYDDWREVSAVTKPGLLSPGTLERKRRGPRDDDMIRRSMRADLNYVHEASLRADLKLIGTAALMGGSLLKRAVSAKTEPATIVT